MTDPFFSAAFDDLFTTYFSKTLSSRSPSSSVGFSYQSELKDEELILTCDLPGVKVSDLRVMHEEGNIVNIEATRKGKVTTGRFTISKTYDVSTPKAVLADGVLELRFSKAKAPQSNVINVTTR